MMAFASLVLDDARSLGAMAAIVMSLHSMLITIGRCYTTDAAGDRAALKLGRVESMLAGAQFYGGRIQLLLPLCLTGDKPELALTIQREDGFYAARTCLTLDMAYNNARLICRSETSWIKR